MLFLRALCEAFAEVAGAVAWICSWILVGLVILVAWIGAFSAYVALLPVQVCAYCFGLDLLPNDRDGRDGIGQVVTIVTATIAGTAAMIAFLQESGTTKLDLVYLIYVPGLVIPIAAMCVLLRLKQSVPARGEHEPGGWRQYYNRPTAWALRLAIPVSVLILVSVVVAGTFNLIPGQRPLRRVSLIVGHAERYTWDSLTPDIGIEAFISIDHDNYPGNYPDELDCRFSLNPPLRQSWSITKVLLEENVVGREDVEVEEHLNYPDSLTPDDFNVTFFEVPNESKTYRITVFLQAERVRSDGEIDTDLKLITDGKGLKIDGPPSP